MYKLSLIKDKAMYDKGLLINLTQSFLFQQKKTILKVIHYH